MYFKISSQINNINMTKQLKWRLGKLPTPDEVLKLVNDKLITKEEARDILFNEQEDSVRDTESLETEIKFLRELVSKLSNNQTTKIVEVIREVDKGYYKYNWYKPYDTYCSANYVVSSPSIGGTNPIYLTNNGTVSNASFTDIQTF